jgi:glycosyltransferase involved in cell wall biosynthesis
MKLLIYAHAWAPTVGGIQTITLGLARGLAQQTGSFPPAIVDVTLATTTPAAGMDDSALPFRVVRRPGPWQLFRMIRDADFLHVAGPCLLPLVFGWLLRKPRVVEHHGFQAICPNGLLLYQPTRTPCPGHFMAGRHLECLRCNRGEGQWRSMKMWALTFVRRWLSAEAAANIVPTRWLGSLLQLPRTRLIYHGLPAPEAARRDAAEACGAHALITFFFVGRLVSTKGLELLLRAAHQLRISGLNFRVNIIGDGPERGTLENLVRDLELIGCVVFHGRLPDVELRALMRQSDAIVIPAIGGEVFGLAAAEAMLEGHPAIVPQGEALTEVVGDAGLLFPPADAAGLAACMQKLIQNPALCRELGEKSRRRAFELFAERSMVEAHASLYQQVVTAAK